MLAPQLRHSKNSKNVFEDFLCTPTLMTRDTHFIYFNVVFTYTRTHKFTFTHTAQCAQTLSDCINHTPYTRIHAHMQKHAHTYITHTPTHIYTTHTDTTFLHTLHTHLASTIRKNRYTQTHNVLSQNGFSYT